MVFQSMAKIGQSKRKVMDSIFLKNQIEIYKKILSLTPGHLYWKDSDGIYRGCNLEFANTLGLNNETEIIGKNDYDFLTQQEADKIAANDRYVMETNKSVIYEEQGLDQQKKPAFYYTKKIPLLDETGKVIGIIGVSLDITDRKKAEEELKLAKEKAEAANTAKTEFLDNMRHDLKTPFSGILGIAECLEANEPDPIKKENLSYISKSARVLLGHINEILEYIRTTNGHLPLITRQFDILQLVQDVCNMMRPEAKKKKLAFTLNKNKNVPQYLIGDDIRTQRILINLLSNALKFTKEGFVTLDVQMVKKTGQKIILKFLVKDSGIGMPLDKQDKIFEHFGRLHPSYQGIYPGIGLGLRMVKQFLEELGGKIQVQSKVGKGTTFKILIPYTLSLEKGIKS